MVFKCFKKWNDFGVFRGYTVNALIGLEAVVRSLPASAFILRRSLDQNICSEADDCDAFDSDVDEAPTAHTIFMENLSSTDPVYDEASPSYDLDILSKVPDHDNYQDAACEHHKVHEMHDDVQSNYVVDSHTYYASDSNLIPYDQYVKDNVVSIVKSNVSSMPNDACVFRGYTVNALIGLEAVVRSLPASAFILRRSLDQNICSEGILLVVHYGRDMIGFDNFMTII
nr:hypothetical protein [Tanacetum cinerariifolium]